MSLEHVEDAYALSPAQQGMMFHALENPSSSVYLSQCSGTIQAPFDPVLWRKAWEMLLERHEILRSGFFWEGMDKPLQVVQGTLPLRWREIDARKDPVRDFERIWTQLCNEERGLHFEPEDPPLFRLLLVRKSETEWRFLLTIHHLLMDGWSRILATQEVEHIYHQLSQGVPVVSESPVPYKKYIEWLEKQDLARAEIFWKERFSGWEEATPIPLEEESHESAKAWVGETSFEQYEEEWTSEESARALEWAQSLGITLNTLFQAAWALLLARCTHQHDVTFGVVVSGRNPEISGIEKMVGLLINVLPFRVGVDEGKTVESYLREVAHLQMSGMKYESTPLVELTRWAGGSLARPLFHSLYVFENLPTAAQGNAEKPVWQDLQIREHSHYDLTVLVLPGERIGMMSIVNPQRYRPQRVHALLKHWKHIILQMMRKKEQVLEKLEILIPEERRLLLSIWNEPSLARPRTMAWTRLFEDQARHISPLLAVICGEHQVTYEELNQRANQWARFLVQCGIRPNECIGLCLERSVDLIVGLLGILKAGAAYVPMDPDYPADRLAYYVKDTGLKWVLTTRKLTTLIRSIQQKSTKFQEIFVDDGEGPWNHQSVENLPSAPSLNHLAYIIYTSGSTGNPKGVMVHHGNLVSSTLARLQYYREPVQGYLLLSSFAFDSSVAGIFWTLLQGGRLCLPEPELSLDAHAWVQIIEAHQVSHVLAIPSVWSLILSLKVEDRIRSLRTVIVAGETCPVSLVKQHFERCPWVEMFNEYGPTEATVWSTVFSCRDLPAGARTVPIGRTAPHVQGYVMDDKGRPVPMGIAGELWISGPGVSQGYWNQAALTAEKFVNNVYMPATGDRFYRTGDWVRYNESGQLEFLGRRDRQVKVRGYRIELEEVEDLIRSYPGVKEVVVLGCEMEPELDFTDDDLARELAKIPSDQVETWFRMKKSIGIEAETSAGDGEGKTGGGTGDWVEKEERFEIHLRIKDAGFVHPPRDSQRNWLLEQAMNEMKADLIHLDEKSRCFVPGQPHDLELYEIEKSELSKDEIMEDWQTPLMKAMVKQVTGSGGDILEVGFGRGVSAEFIQLELVRSHTIIEANPFSIKNYFEPWKKRHPGKRIRMVEGLWQEVLDQLTRYDGIFFHTFPLNEKEFIEYVVNSVTFAEHAFEPMAKLLRPGGSFTYLTTEIDSLSRRHQRALLKYFKSFSVQVEPLRIPENTHDTWWADSMVVIRAIK